MTDPDDEQVALRNEYDRWLRRDAVFPGAERQERGSVVRHVLPLPRRSFVIYADLTPETAEAAIAAQTAFFAKRGSAFEWKIFGHDQPPDLGARLVAHGFTATPSEANMVLATDRLSDVPAPAGVEIARLTSPEQLGDVQNVLEAVWGGDFDWVHRVLAADMAIPGYLSVYVASVEGQPAGVAWVMFPDGPFATLWAGSTLAAFRGRGVYKALLRTRINEARARGKRYVTVDAGAMSRPILERLGFQELTTATEYVWEAEKGAAGATGSRSEPGDA